MDLSILIVNWNAAHYLKPCLASVCREVKGIEFEVIVVDNASYDGCGELIRTEFPQATFIQSGQNLGFIRGNNLIYRYAKGRNILFLNPDTEIIGDAIQKMVSYLETLCEAGVIGCRLVNADGTVQTNSIQTFPTIMNQLLDADFLRRRFPNSSLWNLRPLYEASAGPVEVDSVSGACLMIKRSIFESVGLMSEDYLMYGDDLDLSYKVKKAGYKVYYTNQSHVVHYGGKSTASWKEALADVWIRDSIHKFLSKFRGRWYGGLYKGAMVLVAAIRLIILGCARLLLGMVSRRERLVISYTRWKRILEWALGLKHWSKKAAEELGFSAREW
jgi:GT2 family glycosyltransferase